MADSVFAVSPPPVEDIHYQAEHFAEAAQDARYFAMPWPVGNNHDKDWRPLVSVAVARESIGYATADGGMLTIGASKALSDRWSIDLVAYYDRFTAKGTSTNNSMLPFSVNGVPLDLPETAVFSNPRGEFIHSGVGMMLSDALDYGDAWRWSMFGGLLVEQLTLRDYQFDYQLTGGANAGATGVLDHSGSNTLVYGVFGIQAGKFLTEKYELIPRLVLGIPVKNGDFTARISGAGFDLSTESTGAEPHQIGDSFIYAGATVRDTHTHFEMDLGAILGYEVFEITSHEGIKSALMVSLTWRG